LNLSRPTSHYRNIQHPEGEQMNIKVSKFLFPSTFLFLLLSLSACGRDDQQKEQAALEPAAQTGQLAEQTETRPPLPPGVTSIKGTVLEVIDAGSFIYILLDRGDKKSWATIPPVGLEKGEEVTLILATVFNNFYSKALDRLFDELIFASGVEGKTPKKRTAQDRQDRMKRRSMQLAGAPTPSSEPAASDAPEPELEITKADVTKKYTVGDTYTKAAELADSKVVVTGKVVKVTQNVMGKNWIHIQDGTGDEARQQNDLVVITTDLPAKDSNVRVEGVLRTDKDFGSGYSYAIVVEEATISQN